MPKPKPAAPRQWHRLVAFGLHTRAQQPKRKQPQATPRGFQRGVGMHRSPWRLAQRLQRLPKKREPRVLVL
jgi:hypothetical protein